MSESCVGFPLANFSCFSEAEVLYPDWFTVCCGCLCGSWSGDPTYFTHTPSPYKHTHTHTHTHLPSRLPSLLRRAQTHTHPYRLCVHTPIHPVPWRLCVHTHTHTHTHPVPWPAPRPRVSELCFHFDEAVEWQSTQEVAHSATGARRESTGPAGHRHAYATVPSAGRCVRRVV